MSSALVNWFHSPAGLVLAQLGSRVDWLHYLFIIPLCLISIFLILVILVQRGRGGGLTGALGGMGGQSAFGTKAGDLFTRITIGVATFWIVLCAFSVKMLNDTGTNLLSPTSGGAARTATELPGAPATGTPPAETGKEGAAAPAPV